MNRHNVVTILVAVGVAQLLLSIPTGVADLVFSGMFTFLVAGVIIELT